MPKLKPTKRPFDSTDISSSVRILKPPPEVIVPECPHGPMILFTRKKMDNDQNEETAQKKIKTANGQTETTLDGKEDSLSDNSKSFFACSAYRDRKMCPFFYFLNDKKLKNEEFMLERNKLAKQSAQTYDHKALFKNYKELQLIDTAQRRFCSKCNMFMKRTDATCCLVDVLGFDHSQCSKTQMTVGIPFELMVNNPLKLFSPQNSKSGEAQFYFNSSTVEFVSSWADKYQNVIGIGVPSVMLKILSAIYLPNYSGLTKNAFCLDLDWKLSQLFHPKFFAQFNLCNQYFFTDFGKENFDKFVSKTDKEERVLVLIDPPYGVKVEIIARLIKFLESKFKVDVILSMPYFLESSFSKKLKHKLLKMTDYRVGYEGHRVYSVNNKRGSPARLFTNIALDKFILPETAYKFCARCKKYTHESNKHCRACNQCCTKDGPTYVHCKVCRMCVKPSFMHCPKCASCHLEEFKCPLKPIRNSNKFRKISKKMVQERTDVVEKSVNES